MWYLPIKLKDKFTLNMKNAFIIAGPVKNLAKNKPLKSVCLEDLLYVMETLMFFFSAVFLFNFKTSSHLLQLFRGMQQH